jgi:hypothetical protein
MDLPAIIIVVMGIAVSGFVTINFILETFVKK